MHVNADSLYHEHVYFLNQNYLRNNFFKFGVLSRGASSTYGPNPHPNNGKNEILGNELSFNNKDTDII
jgi:hypothetical protein